MNRTIKFGCLIGFACTIATLAFLASNPYPSRVPA